MAESIPRLQASDSPETITAALDESGAVVVEGLLGADVLARFNAELDPILEAIPDGRKTMKQAYEVFFGPHTRHVAAVAARSRAFVDEILLHPLLLQVCDAVLLPMCASYQLNIAHVLDRGPGSEQQYLHRDEDVWPHVPRPHGTLQLASMIALEDFDAENGATRLVPGSHRWPPERRADYSDLMAAEMPAGAAVLYLGSTIHGGGPNVSKHRRRRGMHLSYLVGWLRTEENNYLTTPPDVARQLPRRAQELLGYAAHDAIALGGGACGMVNTYDPIELLESGQL